MTLLSVSITLELTEIRRTGARLIYVEIGAPDVERKTQMTGDLYYPIHAQFRKVSEGKVELGDLVTTATARWPRYLRPPIAPCAL